MRRLILLFAFLALAGCSGKQSDHARKPLTQAQRDSVLAASQLPGAGVVGRALSVSDSATARAQRMNAAAGR